mgnify:FL=1
MLENVKAVIFDLDGTMADSMWVWTSVDRDYIDQYKLDIPQGFYEEIEGMSFTETAQHFLDVFPQITLSLDEIKEAWIKMAEEKYRNEVSLKRGIREFLEDLKQRGIRIGMATSNSRVLAEGLLKSNGIREYFDEIWTSCDVKAGKPAPDVYLKVAEELHVDPRECLVFEDVPMGIMAGKNAGMKVCAGEDEFSAHQRARKKELADYYIRDYYEIKTNSYEVL